MKSDRDGLNLISSCPVCETPYASAQMRVLGAEGEAQVVHATCNACGNAMLALVMKGRVGAGSIGLATDLTAEDVLRFKTVAPVTIDDVIETHAFVEGSGWKGLMRAARKSRARVREGKRP